MKLSSPLLQAIIVIGIALLGAAVGAVEPGKRADLLLLEANPLQDISASRRIAGVMAQGRWFLASRLQEMRASVERLAAVSQ